MEKAKLLVKSLLGRLDKSANGFLLPGGKLSSDEVAALALITGIELETRAGRHLSLEAFDRAGPPEAHLRMCLDFGTAMSKAWATGRTPEETVPLLIGRPADIGDVLAVPSSIYIAENGRIYIGLSAERQHRDNVRPGRARFDNLKRVLSEEPVGSDLYSLPLRKGIDPTDSGLSPGHLLVLYLAWLTDMAEKALSDAVTATAGAFDGQADLRAVVRRYAIPCFEEAEDDRGHGKERALWAREIMTDALLRAQVLADTLSNSWADLSVAQLLPLMGELLALNVSPLRRVLAVAPEIREPIAAGASRFDAALDTGGEVLDEPVRRLLMVIDAGAGTTDFALFQAVIPVGDTRTHYGLLQRSVLMSRIAGNDMDAILRPLILKSCGINPTNGTPRNEEDFAYILADLDSQIRDIKRRLFENGNLEIELKPNAQGAINLETFVTDPEVAKREQELLTLRRKVVASVFSASRLTDVRSVNRLAGPYPIQVLLTGGSSALPAIQKLASGLLDLDSAVFIFQLVDELPEWIDSLPLETSELVASVYPQCAVAIGGSVPELPEQLPDLRMPITPPTPGKRIAERFRTEGPL